MTKRKNHRDALRELLADGDLHGQWECVRVAGLRYGARLFELRNHEHLNIETVQLSGEDRFAYRWIREEQGVLL